MKTIILFGTFQRPLKGIFWNKTTNVNGIPFRAGIGWQSNGGLTRFHPSRALPYTLEAFIPQNKESGSLIKIHILGIFSLWAGSKGEKKGDIGANLLLIKSGNSVFNVNIIFGIHYFNSLEEISDGLLNGDGSTIETIDFIEYEGKKHRVDILTLEIPPKIAAEKLKFCVHRTPSSFIIFDIAFEFGIRKTCPFKSGPLSIGVSLAEIGVILRVQDRFKFYIALEQLKNGMLSANDVDETRSLALTFLAIISASLLELDAPRGLHRLQLDMARKLDKISSKEQITLETFRTIRQITQHIIPFEQKTTGLPLIDRAIAYVDKNFAREICDESVAKQLNISTSHFRHLFREFMKQPFHKYLVGLRLERSRLLLLQTDLPVYDVARSVGFNNISHFCRAFSKRFLSPPSSVRIRQKTKTKTIDYSALFEEEIMVS